MSIAPQSFLKWVGGKRQLLMELLKYVPESFNHYYEPFLGGGALFFKLVADDHRRSRRCVLNDSNVRLIETYKAVRDRLDPLLSELAFYEKNKHSEEFYYDSRKRIHGALESRAAQFIYWNRRGFNGLWRVNKRGEYNVPFGKYDNPLIYDDGLLRSCSGALKGTKLHCVDFETAVGKAEKGDLCYFDPPYWPVSATANFTGYTKDGFGPEQQERLRDLASRLKRKGVRVILSNADVPEVRALYRKGFELHRVEARRNVNSKGSGRGKVGEVIIT